MDVWVRHGELYRPDCAIGSLHDQVTPWTFPWVCDWYSASSASEKYSGAVDPPHKVAIVPYVRQEFQNASLEHSRVARRSPGRHGGRDRDRQGWTGTGSVR